MKKDKTIEMIEIDGVYVCKPMFLKEQSFNRATVQIVVLVIFSIVSSYLMCCSK